MIADKILHSPMSFGGYIAALLATCGYSLDTASTHPKYRCGIIKLDELQITPYVRVDIAEGLYTAPCILACGSQCPSMLWTCAGSAASVMGSSVRLGCFG